MIHPSAEVQLFNTGVTVTLSVIYTVSQNKGSTNKKKILKIVVAFYGYIFYMILTYTMLTIIDQKIIEFHLSVFGLCPFFCKGTKI